VTANLSRAPLTAIIRETVPFIVVLMGALAFITYVPDSVLWLPRLLGYKG
jgi:TRAP-type C4-dicarboxylate transport system permease large subunit